MSEEHDSGSMYVGGNPQQLRSAIAEERGRRGENPKQYAGRQVTPVGETWAQLLPEKCQWKISGWFHQAKSKLGCSRTNLSFSLHTRSRIKSKEDTFQTNASYTKEFILKDS